MSEDSSVSAETVSSSSDCATLTTLSSTSLRSMSDSERVFSSGPLSRVAASCAGSSTLHCVFGFPGSSRQAGDCCDCVEFKLDGSYCGAASTALLITKSVKRNITSLAMTNQRRPGANGRGKTVRRLKREGHRTVKNRFPDPASEATHDKQPCRAANDLGAWVGLFHQGSRLHNFSSSCLANALKSKAMVMITFTQAQHSHPDNMGRGSINRKFFPTLVHYTLSSSYFQHAPHTVCQRRDSADPSGSRRILQSVYDWLKWSKRPTRDGLYHEEMRLRRNKHPSLLEVRL